MFHVYLSYQFSLPFLTHTNFDFHILRYDVCLGQIYTPQAPASQFLQRKFYWNLWCFLLFKSHVSLDPTLFKENHQQTEILPVALLQTSQSSGHDSKHQQVPWSDWYCPSIIAWVQSEGEAFLYSGYTREKAWSSQVCLSINVMPPHCEHKSLPPIIHFSFFWTLVCSIKDSELLSGITRLCTRR